MSIADPRKMQAQEREAFHRNAELSMQPFRYEKPSTDRVKSIVSVAKGEFVRIHVQIVKDGGENNLHYHTGSETAWMVLKGRVRFYGVGDEVIGEYGPQEGILIPSGARYWFEKIGDEDLELLQMVGYDRRDGAQAGRINVEAHKEWMTEPELQVYE
jgi:mannose-6-phosphate isomerase-like protein (cupin superfamily)